MSESTAENTASSTSGIKCRRVHLNFLWRLGRGRRHKAAAGTPGSAIRSLKRWRFLWRERVEVRRYKRVSRGFEGRHENDWERQTEREMKGRCFLFLSSDLSQMVEIVEMKEMRFYGVETLALFIRDSSFEILDSVLNLITVLTLRYGDGGWGFQVLWVGLVRSKQAEQSMWNRLCYDIVKFRQFSKFLFWFSKRYFCCWPWLFKITCVYHLQYFNIYFTIL